MIIVIADWMNPPQDRTIMKTEITRRRLLQLSAAAGAMAAVPFSLARGSSLAPKPLKAPASGRIPVAFLVSEGAVVIDFAGPWEVFQDAMPTEGQDHPFQLYTVAETTNPIRASGGMRIVPDYTFETAPAPKVLVIAAQNTRSDAAKAWIRKSTESTDVTMSVCTGAFLLASTGLLSGKVATTHHGEFDSLAMQFPDVEVRRGVRFVEEGNLATSGGLTSGIDLALHVVERYYGHEAAVRTADNMEYQGRGWMDAASNAVYAKARKSTKEHPLCAVCSMDIDPKTAPKSGYKGKTYYFCGPDHKELFDASPERFVKRATNR
jgi:transcriptional regulator GlxA family with amidase domain